ncbi:Sua5/YciO/YrdC/YwlC family protein [Alteromonas sp. ASW11-19]|uniref:Threonylcarbamoyl-AMP synthase n=1 Tax=Alteromonas salexigens TaxID=2982530 RepID=A0ABT2VLC6_9ALTE|nr:Sua5/YciO/YrdC/YwlC family protein [Alteromonas salexigens]MCU7553643.1 Sua5/YciO/YrdC/YwlC family protein [Alteromonas salexigens]
MQEQVPSQSAQDPALTAFSNGQLLVYPTEAVMGIGCDPDNEAAVAQLLALKQRPVEKGVILVAATYSQLLPYVDDEAIGQDRRTEIFSSWPGHITWILPKAKTTPAWITGAHDTLAVRVSAHPVVCELCHKFGKPLVSTSANLSGQPPAMSVAAARSVFGDSVYYVEGALGGRNKPSVIRDGRTGAVIRE